MIQRTQVSNDDDNFVSTAGQFGKKTIRKWNISKGAAKRNEEREKSF